MQSTRAYKIHARGPKGARYPTDKMTGGYSCAALDAARNYAGLYLPHMDVLPGRIASYTPTGPLWRFEAIPKTGGNDGATIWAAEL